MKHLSLIAVVFALCIAVPTMAQAYVAADSWAETHGITIHKLRGFSANVEKDTNGDIQFKVFSGGALVPAKGMISALRDGVAQYGHITSAYLPSDMPMDNVLNDLSFVADDPMAAAFATIEVKFNNPDLQAEYARNGVVFGTGYSMTTYYLICRKPIRSLEDLKGLRIRTGSKSQIKWANEVGAVSVSVPATEIYTGLQRGTIDATCGDASFLTTSFQLVDVAKSTTLLSLGTHTSGGEYFNAKFWAERTPEERTILFKNLARASSELQVDWARQAEAALKHASEKGVELIKPTQKMMDTQAGFISRFLAELPAASMKDRGVSDPSAMIDQYLAAQNRWKELLKNVDRTDVDALTKMLIDEIFSKVDVTTYPKK